jgi:hypothetical protein
VSVKGGLPVVAAVASVVSRAPLRLLLVRGVQRTTTGLQSNVVRLFRLGTATSSIVGLAAIKVSTVLLSRRAAAPSFIRRLRLKVFLVVLVKVL